jgi:hypothetical protein
VELPPFLTMAIRRPGINSPTWLYQDFLYHQNGEEQLRYVQVKWDGEIYDRVSQTFDYSNPPYPDADQRGGSIVAQIDYTVIGKTVTIDDWSVNWQDEWPLRLAANYLRQCLYSSAKGYVVRVDKTAYAFWVSEQFNPVTNDPNDFLFG